MICRDVSLSRALRSRQRGFLLSPYRFAAGGGGGYATQLLMHMDGTNGGTTFVEETGKTVVRTGSGITTSTAQAKFGTASATGFASGSTLSVAGAGAMAGDFSLGAWFWWDGTSSGNKAVLCTAGGTEIYLRSASSNALTVYSSGVNKVIGSAPSANAWHLAFLERVGSTVCLTLDGVSQGTFSDSGTFIGGNFYIGSYNDGSETFKGYIDDAYVRTGSALFGGGAFTPPASAFTL